MELRMGFHYILNQLVVYFWTLRYSYVYTPSILGCCLFLGADPVVIDSSSGRAFVYIQSVLSSLDLSTLFSIFFLERKAVFL